jgi:hypothetical protein
MKRVWVLVVHNRASDDDVLVFSRRRDAESSALEFAHAWWPDDQGEPPATYEDALRVWESGDVWGSEDSRWELMHLPLR